MQITATEIQKNFGKYLELSATEEIIITKNGKPIARLSNINDHEMDTLRSFKGILQGQEISLETVRDERLQRQCNI